MGEERLQRTRRIRRATVSAPASSSQPPNTAPPFSPQKRRRTSGLYPPRRAVRSRGYRSGSGLIAPQTNVLAQAAAKAFFQTAKTVTDVTPIGSERRPLTHTRLIDHEPCCPF